MPGCSTMTRLGVLVTIAVLNIAAMSASGDDAKATAAKGMQGSWEGTLKVTPQVDLRITLDVSGAKDGSLSGKWGSPDEGLKDLPLGSIALKDGVVKFATKHGASYQGKLNRAETEVVGEWKQGGKTFPITFKRFDPSKVVVAPIPKELEGIWEGKLKVNGGIELRLVLKVEKGKDGALKAVLISPDQSAQKHPHQHDRPEGPGVNLFEQAHRGEVHGEEECGRDRLRGPVRAEWDQVPADAEEDREDQLRATTPDAEAPVPVWCGGRHV